MEKMRTTSNDDENKAKKERNQCFVHGILGLLSNSKTDELTRNCYLE